MSGLEALTGTDGVYRVLAIDHRAAFANAFRRAAGRDPEPGEAVAVKRRLVAALRGEVSAILIDPEAAAACGDPGVPLLMPLEEQGHETADGGRLNALTADFGPADARRAGASACKLLLYYRPDHVATRGAQRELAVRAAGLCHDADMPLVLEPLVHRLDGEDEAAYAAAFGELVLGAARDLVDCGTDVLKLQFPGDAARCRALTEACRPLRWALLGGADVDAEMFAAQLGVACREGAAGFIAGRTLWGGALGLDATAQQAWIDATARPLLQRLSAIAVAS